MSDGQAIAAQWFGLAPFWWGWITLLSAAMLSTILTATAVRRKPFQTQERSAGHVSTGYLIAAVGIVMLVHCPGFFGSFNIFDDYRQIHWEARVNDPSVANFLYLLTENYKGSNQEFMYVSFLINWAVAGDAYWVWYLANWLLLAPLCLLVAAFAAQMSTNKWVPPLAVSIFGTTPIVSEIMCWMSARSHLYGLLCALTSVVTYLYAGKSQGRRRVIFYAGSVLAFLFSQFCKPIFLFVPVWLVILDVYFRRSDRYLAVLDKIPYVLVALHSAWRIAIAGAGQSLIRPRPLGGSYLNTILQDFNQLVEYARSLILPLQTGVAPPFNEASGWLAVEGTPMVVTLGFAPAASLGILACLFMSLVVLAVRGGYALPILGFLLAVTSFATVLNIPNRGPAATFEYRYTLSAAVVVAIVVSDMWLRLFAYSRRLGRGVLAPALTAWLFWRIVVTLLNTHAWGASERLWVRSAHLYPHSYYAHYYAGKALQWKGRHHAALKHLFIADEHNLKNDPPLWKRIGDNCYSIRDYDCATTYWARYFRVKPQDVTKSYEKKFAKAGIVWDPRRRRFTPSGTTIAPAGGTGQ